MPSILIPFPYSAEGHQKANAEILKRSGAAEILDNSKLDELPELIERMITDKKKLENMGKAATDLAKRDAAKRIVDLINE